MVAESVIDIYFQHLQGPGERASSCSALLFFPAAGPGTYLIQADTLPQRFQRFNSMDTHPNRASLAWTHSLDHCFLAVGRAMPPLASTRPLEGIWAVFLHGPHEAYCWGKTNAELLSSSLACCHDLFSLLLPLLWPSALGVRAWVLGGVWCHGAVPPLSELLARQSPAKPPGLWGGGGRRGRKGPADPGGMWGR